MSVYNRGVDGQTTVREVTFPEVCYEQLLKIADLVQNMDPEIYCEVYVDKDISSISFTTYETLDGEREL